MHIEAYFDESGTDGKSRHLCVAGYIFDRDRCAEMTFKWSRMLSEFQLPYFRMSQCAPDPGNGPFARLSKAQRIDVATRAIDLIKSHAIQGVAVSVDKRFAHLIPTYGYYRSPYTFACWHVLMAVRRWMQKAHFKGDASYFFEDGHQSQGEAHRLMSAIFAEPLLKAAYRASSFGFGKKEEMRPLQCADIYAWHWSKRLKNLDRGISKHRADFNSLLDIAHLGSHYDEKMILSFPETIKQLHAYQLEVGRRYSGGFHAY
ncbi:DUF3800 domain-containing protein [Usitatibacter palustris]|uniref:DUF3800 domain-containing protein n=1 Tax=Usitatibacter palustris TaxID=2732487 RepID=UPI001BB29A98|nr:DUF3800 domain-containing protein [Usitatibacter palustris]